MRACMFARMHACVLLPMSCDWPGLESACTVPLCHVLLLDKLAGLPD